MGSTNKWESREVGLFLTVPRRSTHGSTGKSVRYEKLEVVFHFDTFNMQKTAQRTRTVNL